MTEGPAVRRGSTAKADPIAAVDTVRTGRFIEILDRYQGGLLRYARRVSGCPQDQAEDIVQECFLRLHRAWGRTSEPPMRHVGAWLFTVAHNLTMDLIRRQGRRAVQEPADPAAEAEAELCVLGRITQSEAAAAALAALDRLPTGQKQVVLLKVLEGLTFRQIAKTTGLSLATVNYRLHQALDALARHLKQSGHL